MKLNILRFKKKSRSLIYILCSLFFFQFRNTLISNKIQLIHLSVLNVTVLTNKINIFSNIHINLPDIIMNDSAHVKVMKIKFFEISIIFNTQCWIRYYLVSLIETGRYTALEMTWNGAKQGIQLEIFHGPGNQIEVWKHLSLLFQYISVIPSKYKYNF